MAPVNAPRTWPKSSDSSSVSGRAPQFWATNCRSRRLPLSWMSRANSSLPVPVSPSSSTVVPASSTLRARLDGLAQPGGGTGDRVEGGRPRADLRDLAPDGVVGQLQLVAQPGVLLRERAALDGAAEDDEQLVGVPRLGHEVIDVAGVDGLHEAVDVGVGGEDDAGPPPARRS